MNRPTGEHTPEVVYSSRSVAEILDEALGPRLPSILQARWAGAEIIFVLHSAPSHILKMLNEKIGFCQDVKVVGYAAAGCTGFFPLQPASSKWCSTPPTHADELKVCLFWEEGASLLTLSPDETAGFWVTQEPHHEATHWKVSAMPHQHMLNADAVGSGKTLAGLKGGD